MMRGERLETMYWRLGQCEQHNHAESMYHTNCAVSCLCLLILVRDRASQEKVNCLRHQSLRCFRGSCRCPGSGMALLCGTQCDSDLFKELRSVGVPLCQGSKLTSAPMPSEFGVNGGAGQQMSCGFCICTTACVCKACSHGRHSFCHDMPLGSTSRSPSGGVVSEYPT